MSSHQLAASVLLGRWSSTVDLFARVSQEERGGERGERERGREREEEEERVVQVIAVSISFVCVLYVCVQVFGETVGRMPGSYLSQERRFEVREREFRREMDSLRSNTRQELLLQVSPDSIPHCDVHIPYWFACAFRWNGPETSCFWGSSNSCTRCVRVAMDLGLAITHPSVSTESRCRMAVSGIVHVYTCTCTCMWCMCV